MRPTLTWEMTHDLPLRPENVLVIGFEKLPSTINTHNTELQMVMVHILTTLNISQ